MANTNDVGAAPVKPIVVRRVHHGVAELYITIRRVKLGIGWVMVEMPNAWFVAVNRERSWKHERAICFSFWRLRFGFKIV